jgi:hypothetical protein
LQEVAIAQLAKVDKNVSHSLADFVLCSREGERKREEERGTQLGSTCMYSCFIREEKRAMEKAIDIHLGLWTKLHNPLIYISVFGGKKGQGFLVTKS